MTVRICEVKCERTKHKQYDYSINSAVMSSTTKDDQKCQICSKSNFKYSCPKCNILYCSLDCYKSTEHQECSEKFYQQCVIDEMKASGSSEVTNSDMKKMYEILEKFKNGEMPDEEDFALDNDEEIDSDDDNDEDDLSMRVAGIDLDDTDALWSCLTADERNAFFKSIDSGKIDECIPKFQPWFSVKGKKQLVEEISKESNEPEIKHTQPKILENTLPFNQLCPKEPPTCLLFNICNILSAYSCIVNYFAGEQNSKPVQAAKLIYVLSENLRENTNFKTKDEAIFAVCSLDDSENWDFIQPYNIIKGNVEDILNGPDEKSENNLYKLSALSDVHHIFSKAKKIIYKFQTTTETPSELNPKLFDHPCIQFDLSKNDFTKVIKKIEYLISFVKQLKVSKKL